MTDNFPCDLLQVLSNIVSVQVQQIDRDLRTWNFTNKVTRLSF